MCIHSHHVVDPPRRKSSTPSEQRSCNLVYPFTRVHICKCVLFHLSDRTNEVNKQLLLCTSCCVFYTTYIREKTNDLHLLAQYLLSICRKMKSNLCTTYPSWLSVLTSWIDGYFRLYNLSLSFLNRKCQVSCSVMTE